MAKLTPFLLPQKSSSAPKFCTYVKNQGKAKDHQYYCQICHAVVSGEPQIYHAGEQERMEA
jgi:hypothetical protein